MALSQISGQLSAYAGSVSAAEAVAFICHSGLLVALFFVCRSDIRDRRIDNYLIGLVALLGGVAALVGALPWGLPNLFMIGAVFVLLGIVWQARVIGGADVKLILACLVWIRPSDVAQFVILIATLGALLGVAVLVTQRILGSIMQERIISQDRARFYLRLIALRELLLGKHPTVPYAVAIAAAQVIMLVSSNMH